MRDLDQEMADRYRNNFLKEIEEQAEMGEWVKLCMQCGLCSGSCPTHFHDGWDHPPHEIFMMIRAGKRDEVLQAKGMWMCTSCYNCYVRCPRKVPVTHVMHGIAEYAYRIGRSPKGQSTQHLSTTFWNNCIQTGRVNELHLTQTLYFKDGFLAGLKKFIEMSRIGLGLARAGRMNPLEAIGAGHKCKDTQGIHAMLTKAKELEAERKEGKECGRASWFRGGLFKSARQAAVPEASARLASWIEVVIYSARVLNYIEPNQSYMHQLWSHPCYASAS